MKTAPSPRARGYSSKSSAKKDATHRKQPVSRRKLQQAARDAREDVENTYGPGAEPEELTEDDDLTEKYKQPAKRPLPVPVPGCTRLVAAFGKSKRTELTQLGLETLRDEAGLGRSPATIAFVLGITRSMFETMTTVDEPARLAYELGKGIYEDRITDSLTRMADHQNVAAAIWLEKTRFGRRDNAPVGDGAKHVHIHLPDSVSREEYMRSIALLHTDSHKQAIEASKETESGNSLPAAPPTWLTEGATIEGQPSNEQLQAQIAQALATPEQRATEKLKERVRELTTPKTTAKALDVDR